MPKPFVNEPFTNFKDPANQHAFIDALTRVEDELGKRHPSVIDGERIRGGDAVMTTHNPSDPSEAIGVFPELGADAGVRAVEAAHAAFPAWSQTPWADRAHLLFEAADRLRRDKHYYSAWMVKEVGKTWGEADGDTAEAIDFMEYYAREALRYSKPIPVVQTEDP